MYREYWEGGNFDRKGKEEWLPVKGRRIMSESNEHDSNPPGPDSPPHDSNAPSPPHESTDDKSTPSNSPPHDSITPSPPPPSQAPPPKSEPPPPKSDSPAPKSSPSPKPSPPPASPPPSSPPPSSPSPSSPPPSSPPPSSSPPKSPSPPPRSPPPSSSKDKPTSGSSPPSPPASPPPPSSTDGNSPKPSSGDSSSPTSPPTDSSQDDKGSPSSPSVSQSPPASPPPATPTTNPTAPSPPTVPSAPVVPGSGATTTQPVPSPDNSTPTLSPPSTRSQVTGDSGGSSRHTGTVVGLTVAGVFIIALVALIVLFVRKRKKQAQPYPPNYMPPTPGPHGGNLSTPGGYYHAQQQSSATSGPTESFYSSGPAGPSSYENSYQGNPPSSGDSGLIAATKVHFTYEELMEITNGFSRQNVIGEGGFGCVYKGWMPDGRVVAVKQLKAGSGQGEKEFRAEVEIISRVHHRYLVSLVGYCIFEQQRLLIYEFVPNKTLEHHLHGAGMPVLEWTKRLKIALGSAKGLAYLHEDCHPKIIHRDIKSANILLDDAFEAQVADFGLAKLTDGTNTHVSTRVMGTFGYMAPEYANSGKLTDRSDVFSFGVVLLELVTGRKPVDPTRPLGDESLVEWARPLLIQALETGDLSKLVDPRLEKHYVEVEMFRMIEAAAACVRHSAPKRPRMAQVVRALDCEGELSDLTNGVKVGQSTAYDSGQYNKEIMRFRRMALGSGGSSEMSSADFTSREVSGPQSLWTRPDASSDESETRAFTTRGGEQMINGNQGRRF
ncbi:proline-rich receptor-like protein kinase PERK12 isoform X2 [Malus sylvestris]|uniref:proline-rich receptor-like protein kinase PERK12 isoform X2 n=1 Tax=Malus sylvestris TaxID=3752 RepID=UPI0021AD2890|nr:proline-rich receptor-like protein kinase PERK12 isoform X2 [Malus sylvestris]